MALVLREFVANSEVVQYYLDVVSKYELQNADPNLIAAFSDSDFKWDEIELTDEEFLTLETPAGWDNPEQPRQHLLMRDVSFEAVTSGDIKQSRIPRRDVLPKLKLLQDGHGIGHLIIRDPLPNAMPGSSFYIEDGFGKSVAIKRFKELGGEIVVRAYRASLEEDYSDTPTT